MYTHPYEGRIYEMPSAEDPKAISVAEHKTLGIGTLLCQSSAPDRITIKFGNTASKEILLDQKYWVTPVEDIRNALLGLPHQKDYWEKAFAGSKDLLEDEPYYDAEWDAMTVEERAAIEDAAADGDEDAKQMLEAHLHYGETRECDEDED